MSPQQPAEDRFTGSAAHGQARAVVDATGRLIDLGLDTGLLRRPAWAVAEAVITAVTQAQDAARQAAEQADEDRAGGARADADRLAADLAAIDEEAQRRLAELQVIVSDLVRRRER